MKITAKGQVTIPREIREKYGLHPNTEVEVVDVGDGSIVRRASVENKNMRSWIEKARGITTGRMTTDEIMQMTRGEGPIPAIHEWAEAHAGSATPGMTTDLVMKMKRGDD